MVAPLTLYLLRHGEVHNPTHILYGRMPGFSLSEAGRGQASAAAEELKPVDLAAIYASPMQRAQETAQIVATAQIKLLDVQTDERLNEVHTPFDGTPHAQLEATLFDIYTGTQPPYEQPLDVRRRVRSFIADMRRQHAGQAIAAVSHGDIVVAMFLYAKQYAGTDIGRRELQSLGLPERYPATASISVLTYHTDDADELPDYQYIRPY